VTPSAGQGGKPNVNWECHPPSVPLPAGTYTVVDPDPATWSHNDASGNAGFSRIVGSLTTSSASGSSLFSVLESWLAARAEIDAGWFLFFLGSY